MTDEELAEMYSSTVKLCQDNKINAKNTWSLNLIDYMGMLVKDMGEEDELASQNSQGDTNFQMAGVTLDAGVRIYCSRVDSVHTNAFKVLGSLSRTGKNEKNGTDRRTNDEVDECDGDEQLTGGEDGETEINKRRKRPGKRKGESTLESNSAVLLQPTSEAVYFDPLFQKMAAAFDEGGAKGMLLNNLCVNRFCEIVFDSSESALEDRSSQTQEDVSADKGEISGSEKSQVLFDDDSGTGASYDVSLIMPARDSLKRPELCPRFLQFYRSRRAGPSQLESSKSGPPALIPGAPENENIGVVDLGDDDDIGGGGFDLMSSEAFLPDISMGEDDDDSACIITRFDDCNDIIRPEVGRLLLSGDMDLMEAGVPLARDSEYSFFDSAALRNWAGPQHWHFRAIPARKNAMATGPLPPTNKKRGKTAMLLDFKSSPNFDFAAEFTRAKVASCQLSAAVRDGFSEKKVTLPEDLQYKTETLASLFLKPIGLRNIFKNRAVSVPAPLGASDDQSSCWYSFDNDGDTDIFCGAADDEEREVGIENPDFDGGHAEPSGPRPVRHSGNDWGISDEPFARENVDIDFGIVAKEVDVKRLQSGIWKQIQGSLFIETESQEVKRGEYGPARHRNSESNIGVRRETTLTNLVQAMPSYVPKESLEDVTLPYIFICLLHLANEKTLSITPGEDGSLDDLVISTSLQNS
jgi:condensin complex subunit 2